MELFSGIFGRTFGRALAEPRIPTLATKEKPAYSLGPMPSPKPSKPRATAGNQPPRATPQPTPKPQSGAGACSSATSDATAPARKRAPQKPPAPANWPDLYIDELTVCGVMHMAAAVACVTVRGVYDRRERDQAFAKREAKALRDFRACAIAEITRRAVHGNEERIETGSGKSRRVVIRTVYSDTLLLRLVEYQETGSFRQKQQIEHSGGFASLPTLADKKKRLEEAKREADADEAASLQR